jgi:hypothetical protein
MATEMTRECETGGPAFPSPTGNAGQGGGITVLDWFAGQALAGLLASDEFSGIPPEALARLSYGQARNMMDERPK